VIYCVVTIAMVLFGGGCSMILSRQPPGTVNAAPYLAALSLVANVIFAYSSHGEPERRESVTLIVGGLIYAIGAPVLMWSLGGFGRFGLQWPWMFAALLLLKGAAGSAVGLVSLRHMTSTRAG